MKGSISTTIAQRQYENIKTHYEFTNEEERKEAIEKSISDCIELSGIVKKRLEDSPETFTMQGITYKKENGKWSFYNKETKKWEGSA